MPASNIPSIQPHQILVQRIEMGKSEAYIGAVTLKWLADRVKYASEMSLLSEQYQPQDQNIEIDSSTIEVIQQRPLDWSRQAALVQYLAGRTTHKFPPVLVTIDRSWVDNIHAPEWGRGGRAIESAAIFTPMAGNDRVGLLDVDESARIYALDGQHRLMGVQGLMELLSQGEVARYNKDRHPVGSKITRAQFETTEDYLESLPQETIGIEFISAVVQGETQLEARRRIRSIFVHVNLMAVALSKGQLAQLDENDGFAIVARNIAVNHPLLKDTPGRKPRVNWDSATVATKTTVLTTLQALQDMAAKYLQYQFPHWKPKAQKGLVPLRPDPAELAAGVAAFSDLFDRISQFTSLGRLKGEDTTQLRRFSFEPGGGEGHILFRPVGQVAFAQGVGMAVFKKQMAETEVFRKLDRYDADGGFSNINLPQSLWYGILYDPNKKRILVSGRDLAAKLIVYLLGGVDNDFDRAELRRQVAEARTIGEYAMSFQGKLVTLQEVGLPSVLK
jgi:DGQHR domain-containing protein